MCGSGVNARLFTENVGRVKVFSIVLGVISLILITVDHLFSDYITEELAFFWSLVVCLSLSLIFAVLLTLGCMDNVHMIQLDMVFHICASILMIIISCFFIVSVDKGREFGGKIYNIRAASGGLGLIYGIVCSFIAGGLF